MSILKEHRNNFHNELIRNKTLTIDLQGVSSFADSHQRTSLAIAAGISQQLGVPHCDGKKLDGQTAGRNFEIAVANFISSTFPLFNHLRPGQWKVLNVGSSRSGGSHIGKLEPYTHLDRLNLAVLNDPNLRSILGNGYSISPDIIVTRTPEEEDIINNSHNLVDEHVATQSIIRAANQRKNSEFAHDILHAVISCKWTIRSDRAQNSRSEALSLIRNRKGRLPHVVALTAEPSPSRLASVAMGTGDLDMVYHFALPELIKAVHETGNDQAIELIEVMVNGARLRDIADLPLDLTI